jgi:succinate dehydrogenase / fumarate reductase cytochrome b subunit
MPLALASRRVIAKERQAPRRSRRAGKRDIFMAERPLSPHIGIWKWGPNMIVSIFHRITGDGLALVALPVLLWWLWAFASGPDAFGAFAHLAGTWYGTVVLVAISWGFFNHLISGLRYFVLDIGAGYELTENKTWSIAALVLGTVITAAFWAARLYL